MLAVFTKELTGHVTNCSCLSSQSRYSTSVNERAIRNCTELAEILFIYVLNFFVYYMYM